MNRMIQTLAAVAVLGISAPAIAGDMHHMSGQKAVTKTVTGEVVDMGCWLGHAARGDKHVSCANKCLAQGMPMGLLTSNGTLYLVTLDQDNAEPYNSLKAMVGKQVAMTGELLSGSGVKAIAISAVQVAGK